MSGIPYGKPRNPAPVSIARGEAGLGDIAGAALEQMLLVENTTAASDALERAYEAWRQDIRAGTGQEPPPNPVIFQEPDFDPDLARARLRGELGFELDYQAKAIDRQKRDFQAWVDEQAARFPREAVKSWSERSPEQDAAALARGADERLAALMDSHPGWEKFAAAFAGGAVGSLRDPVTVGSLALGGGPGAARTIAGRILTTAMREAAINAGTEAAMQPVVQDWRRRAGLDSGFDQALANVAFAAGLGGAFGAGGRAIYEGATFRRRRAQTRELAAQVAATAELPAATQAAIAGDPHAAAQILSEIRDELPAEVRGAIDAVEQEAVTEAQIAEARIKRQAELESRALLHAQNPLLQPPPPARVYDEPRIARLVESLAPRRESITDPQGVLGQSRNYDELIAELRQTGGADRAAPRPIATLLKNRGGIHPTSPLADELRAVGVNARTFPGLFSRRGKRELDNIPRADLPDELQHLLPDDGNGYVSRQGFIDALAKEAEGGTVAGRGRELDEQRAWYERQGIDVEAMSDDQIRARLAEIDDAEQRFLAAGDNAAGLSTDEVAHLPPGITRRAHTEDVVRQIFDQVGKGVSDDVVRVAADAVVMEGETLEDAIEFALSNVHGTPRQTPESAFADHPRTPPDPAQLATDGLDDDAIDLAAELAALEEAGFAGDVRVPWGDDMVSLEDLQRQLDDAAYLETIVEACKA